MLRATNFVTLVALLALVKSSPYDDGRYNPKKYKVFDDGKYYRSLAEGKYVPGHEGKYTYIYQQGLYPDDDGDYRYIHQTGPNGGFGGNGGKGGNGDGGGDGGYRYDVPEGGEAFGGPAGPRGPKGPPGPNGPPGPKGPGGPPGTGPINNYIGRKTYANRYPYIHKVIKSLVDKYVSTDNFGDEYEGSTNHYRKVYADQEIAVKCKYLMPNNTKPEFTTQYPPTVNVANGENFGSYYSFRGTKVLSNSITSKLKLEYEVFVRVVEVDSESDAKKN